MVYFIQLTNQSIIFRQLFLNNNKDFIIITKKLKIISIISINYLYLCNLKMYI
jgi:hypothetical protein